MLQNILSSPMENSKQRVKPQIFLQKQREVFFEKKSTGGSSLFC